jgi:segregation and condensation protein A
MAMAEKTVPWWRRALRFALGGIRSGFGLFQRGAKPSEGEAGENARGVVAGESESVEGGGGSGTAAVAQDKAVESVPESARKNEVKDVAAEIPVAAKVGGTRGETASYLVESEAASERIEPVETEHSAAEAGGEALAGKEAVEVVEEPVVAKEIQEEPGGDPKLSDETLGEEKVEIERIAEEAAHEDLIAGQQDRNDASTEEAIAAQRPEEAEDPHPLEEAAEAEMNEPIGLAQAPGERVVGPPESEAAVQADEVASAPVSGEVEAERIEAAAVEELNETDEAAIEEPVDEKRAEGLETVEAEATVVATEANEPANEQVEEVKAVEAVEEAAEEPDASVESAEAGAAHVEERANEKEIEIEAEDVEEPVIVEGVAAETVEAREDSSDDSIQAETEVVEEAASETPVPAGSAETEEGTIAVGLTAETHASEEQEEVKEEPVTAEAAVMVEAASEEVAETHASEAEGATVAEETAVETEAAEPGAVFAGETDTEAQDSEPEAAQPASVEGTGTLVVAEAAAAMSEEREAAAKAEPETVAAAAAEAVAAPAQMELIPKPPVDEKAAAKLAEQQRRRKQAEEESPFSVMVGQVYEGPLDLLLDLIRKQDIDIYDIPIARITAQFLAYVNQLKASDVDVAGEFIYTASLLIHIKSKMLLPRTAEAPGEAAEDPRRELVERLLEHERFKNAAQMLQQKQMMEAASWSNPGQREFVDDEGAEPGIAADTVDLVRVFREILERARNRPVLDVAEDTVTVGQMIRFLGRRLTMEDKPIALRKLLSHTRSERALIAMFLALLELVRLQAVLLRQDRQFSEIFVKKHAAFETVMNEGLADARDDWR